METSSDTPSPHQPAIRCMGLTMRYGDLVAVRDLHIEVGRGECFGLLGPNGAGKTTTVEAFEGLLAPAAGSIEVLGERWGGGAGDRRLRARIGVALQETQLSETLTVEETLRLFRSFYRSGRTVDEVIDLLGLADKRRARVGRLSGGQRQRLSLACALVGSPEILFLDEPTTGLDPTARLRIWEVVESYVAQGGTVLLTTHYMEEAARLCRRVAILDEGRLVALDRPAALVLRLGAAHVIQAVLESAVDREILRGLPGVRLVEQRGEAVVLVVEEPSAVLPLVIEAASAAGVAVRSLLTREATLEDVFVHLTGKGLRDA